MKNEIELAVEDFHSYSSYSAHWLTNFYHQYKFRVKPKLVEDLREIRKDHSGVLKRLFLYAQGITYTYSELQNDLDKLIDVLYKHSYRTTLFNE